MPAAPMLSARAPAKLNLYIHVLGRRADGYHLIESGVVFTDICDELRVTLADTLTLTTTGEFAGPAGAGGGNLVLKAARALQARRGITKGAAFMLMKNIPVGAGLGGGSADAASALLLLNRLWELNLPIAELHALAPELGADVAMCLASSPVIATGVGEVLDPIACALPTLYAVLVHPRVPLLTADVYQALRAEPLRDHSPFAPNEATPSFTQLLHHLGRTSNDLQRAAIAVSPQVAETLIALETLSPRSAFVRMTGSGACCFALYETHEEAIAAAKNLQANYPEWWVEATALRTV